MASYYYNDHNPFRFPFIFKFGNLREVEITKALICAQESKTILISPNRNLVSRILS